MALSFGVNVVGNLCSRADSLVENALITLYCLSSSSLVGGGGGPVGGPLLDLERGRPSPLGEEGDGEPAAMAVAKGGARVVAGLGEGGGGVAI